MTKDTYDMFDEGKRERGRFGDNESAAKPNAEFKSDLIDVDLSYSGQTPLAIRVKDAGKDWFYLPKSEIEFEMTGIGQVRVTLPRWLAREKGLI